MSAVWLTSDMHFGHEKTCTVFKRRDGSPLRPFANAQEMNDFMITGWNQRVQPNDKVYVLGDCVINRKFMPILGQLNGRKRLVRGNHDIFPVKEYLQYFDEIYSVRVLEDMILSHIPLHPDSITVRFGTNVHGHTHADDLDDPRYLSVCVEHTEYVPITIEEVRRRIKAKQQKYGFVPQDRYQGNGPG